MNSKEKRQLENELMSMGLAGLKPNGDASGELVQQIAGMINLWPGMESREGEWIDKHKYLRDLLNECDADKRAEMYEAIKPHLKFPVKPLSHYETLIAEKAGKMVSQRRARVTGEAPKAVEIGGDRYAILPERRVDAQAVAILTCYLCPKTEKFIADTPTGAMLEARKAGWVRDKALNKEVCPECAANAAAEEIVTLSRNQTLVVNDRRRVN